MMMMHCNRFDHPVHPVEESINWLTLMNAEENVHHLPNESVLSFVANLECCEDLREVHPGKNTVKISEE